MNATTVRRFWLFTLVLVFALLSGMHFLAAEKRARLLTRQELYDTWFGVTDNDLYLIRCNLSDGDKGLFAMMFLDADIKVFKIDSWAYDKGRVSINLEPKGLTVVGIKKVAGDIQGEMLHLLISGKDWSQLVLLRREGPLEKRANLIRDAMKRQEGTK